MRHWHRHELRVLQDEAHVPDRHEYEPDGAGEEEKVAVGPRLHHLDVRPQVEHPQHHVHPVSQLAKSGAMLPAVSKIVPIVLAVFVIGVIWNRV